MRIQKVIKDAFLTLEKNKTGNLFTVLEGSGVIRVGGDSFDVKKGDSFYTIF